MLLGSADPEWDEVLDRSVCDFYHRRSYHALAEAEGEGEAHLAVFGNGVCCLAWPYLRRRIEDSGWYDATCVYGYTGPVLAGFDDAKGIDRASFLADAWRALNGVWAEQQIVSVFTRFHPLLENAQFAQGFEGAAAGPAPALSTLGRTASMDLRLTQDARLAGYDKETRYEIRRARRMGLEVHVDSDFARLDDLIALYNETMLRNGAEERYFFSRRYFEQLVQGLGKRARLLVATFRDGIAGLLLVVVDGPFAQAHITGIAEQHLKLSPLKALLDAAADTAKALGATWLHLGAGRGGAEDELFEFKRRIARLEHRFIIGRWVVNQARYCELAGIDSTSPDAREPKFFPAYRAPPPVRSAGRAGETSA